MNHRQPYLTKSRYIDGLHCEKKLWLGWHEPLPYEEPKPFSPQDVGTRVGKDAHELFPGGIEVTEKPWEHKEAVQKTQQLMADQSIEGCANIAQIVPEQKKQKTKHMAPPRHKNGKN